MFIVLGSSNASPVTSIITTLSSNPRAPYYTLPIDQNSIPSSWVWRCRKSCAPRSSGFNGGGEFRLFLRMGTTVAEKGWVILLLPSSSPSSVGSRITHPFSATVVPMRRKSLNSPPPLKPLDLGAQLFRHLHTQDDGIEFWSIG